MSRKKGYEKLDIHIYFAQLEGPGGPVKIGRANDVSLRMKQLAVPLPYSLRLLASHRGTSLYVAGYTTEKHLHREFSADRIRGEWFAASERLMRYVRFVSTDAGRAMVEREIVHEALTDTRPPWKARSEEASAKRRAST